MSSQFSTYLSFSVLRLISSNFICCLLFYSHLYFPSFPNLLNHWFDAFLVFRKVSTTMPSNIHPASLFVSILHGLHTSVYIRLLAHSLHTYILTFFFLSVWLISIGLFSSLQILAKSVLTLYWWICWRNSFSLILCVYVCEYILFPVFHWTFYNVLLSGEVTG